jgi:Flp pilus assembly protein TadG
MPDVIASRRDDRGVSAVFVSLFMTSMLVAVGLSLDVGNAYVAKAKMQAGADSAALAVARECALKSACASGATATATSMVTANAAGAATTTTLDTTTGTVTVRADKSVPFAFMKSIGVNSKTVRTTAKAKWNNVPIAGYPIFPLALAWCDYQARTTSLKLFQADLALSKRDGVTCRNADNTGNWTSREGALWLVDGNCRYKVSLWAVIRSVVAELIGAPYACSDEVRSLQADQIYVLPLYRAKYGELDPRVEIVGFVPVKISGWRFTQLAIFEISQKSAASANCTRKFLDPCNGITGTFVSTAKKQPDFEYGPGTNLGAALPVLVKE